MYTITFRRGTSSEADARNIILRAGEPGVETDTDDFKIGDGSTPWTLLPAYPTEEKVAAAIQAAVADVEAGSARYTKTFETPSTIWAWVHNLGCRPPVVLFENSDPTQPVYSDVEYPNENTIIVTWPEPTTGSISI